MFTPRWSPNWRSIRRRCCVAVALLAYLLTTFGYPLPATGANKSSVAFPCQNHPCGCQSSEQCWKSCCCFTVEERWAWARANHVEPPDYAEKPREQVDGQTACAEATHCQHEHESENASGSCCSTEKPSHPRTDASATTGVRWTVGLSVLRCKGYGTEWVDSGAVVSIPPPIAWNPDLPLLDEFICSETFTTSNTAPPPVPPPRAR